MNNLTPEEIKHLKALARREKDRAALSWTCLLVFLVVMVGSGVAMYLIMQFIIHFDISQPGR